MPDDNRERAEKNRAIDPLDRIYVRSLSDNPRQSLASLRDGALITPRQLVDNIEEHMALLFIHQNMEDFENSDFSDPQPALSAFIRSVDYGVYPPLSVLVWLCNAFKRFQNGTALLEDILGFEAGRQSPYFKATLDGVKLEALMERAVLVSLMAVAPAAADEIVGKKFSLDGKPRSASEIKAWLAEKQKEYGDFVDYFGSRDLPRKQEIIKAAFSRLNLYDAKGEMSKALEKNSELVG